MGVTECTVVQDYGEIINYKILNVLRDIQLKKFNNIFKRIYECPEKYKPKNKRRKIKKNYL